MWEYCLVGDTTEGITQSKEAPNLYRGSENNFFGSDVKTALDDDGNVIVRETRYENISGEPTRTTNESAVRYLRGME